MRCAGCAVFRLSSGGHQEIHRAVGSVPATVAHVLIADMYQRWVWHAVKAGMQWQMFDFSFRVDRSKHVQIVVFNQATVREACFYATGAWLREQMESLGLPNDAPTARIWRWGSAADLIEGSANGEMSLVGDVTLRARFAPVPRDGTMPEATDSLLAVAAKFAMEQYADSSVWAFMRRLVQAHHGRIYRWLEKHAGQVVSISQALEAVESVLGWAALLPNDQLWNEVQEA